MNTRPSSAEDPHDPSPNHAEERTESETQSHAQVWFDAHVTPPATLRQRLPSTMFGDSWGGWIVLLCSVAVVVDAAGALLLDGRRLVETSAYRTIEVRDGNTSVMITAMLWLAMLGIAGVAILERLERIPVAVAFATPILLAFAWGAIASFLRGDAGRWPFEMAALTVSCLALMASPPTRTTLARLNTLRDVVALTTVLYSGVDASTRLPCRDDKCGVFGTIWPGYFSHENSAGSYVALLAPAMIVSTGSRFVFSNAALILFLAASASRTALLAYLATLVFVVLYRNRVRLRSAVSPNALWRLFPLGSLTLSGLLYFIPMDHSFLTGRGMIFAAARAAFTDTAKYVLGIGPQILQDGIMGGWIHTAHGEVPHLMLLFGFPGLLLVAVALSTVAVTIEWTWQRTVALGFLVGLGTRFLTEAGMLTELRSQEAAVLLLCVGLFSARSSPVVSSVWTASTQRLDRASEEPWSRPPPAHSR